MPSIMAVPYPTRGHVLVEVNFADVPGATNICVEAVTSEGTSDEVRRQLHPYVSYNSSGCLTLSCGQGIFWDTEISCGVATTYCATAMNAAGEVVTTAVDPLILDTFTRVVAANWSPPAADSGQSWTTTGGAAADYSVTGTRGQVALTNTNVSRRTIINGPMLDGEIHDTLVPTVVATGAPFGIGVVARQSVGNDYIAEVSFDLVGAMNLRIRKNVAGVVTTLSTTALTGTYTAATLMQIVFRFHGNQLSARAWDATTPDPVTMQSTVTDSSLTAAGAVGTRQIRETGNTNGTINVQHDNYSVLDVCEDLVPVEECTEPVTIECDGCFRLGNPVRPCDDVRICLCADPEGCETTGGLFFVGMTPDTRASNSGQMLPVNDRYPIPVSRARMKPTSNLTVSATSFTARDTLINLLDPGEPLLLRTTPEFGIGDRYLQIGDATETYGLADMTIQPRLMNLPNAEVRAPVGPSLGVCGSRVMDLCDIYDTWTEIVAAGLTFADLLRGEASPPGSGLATWADINAQNASWTILLANEPDWNDVLDGD